MLKRLSEINFVRIGKLLSLNSLFFIVLMVISLFYIGLNWGIDFSSGTMYEILFDSEEYPDISQVRNYLDKEGYKGFFVQNFGSDKDIAIKIKAQSSISEMTDFKNRFLQYFEKDKGYHLFFYKTDFVGAGISAYVIKSGICSVIMALVGVMIYLYFRFNMKFAIISVIALIHDILFLLGFFVVTRLEFNISSVSAVLIIIGYSINDTVVIFDKIRNMASNDMKNIDVQTINNSIVRCLKRTALTSLTTIASCFTLVMFTRGEIRDFGIIVMFGVFIGTMSSVFIATYLISLFEKFDFRIELNK